MTVIVAILEKVKRRLFYTATALVRTPGGKAMVEKYPAIHRVLALSRERAA